VIRPILWGLLVAGCFDPLYELGPDRSWIVCCRSGLIDTCECLDPELMCPQQLTACARDTCVPQGACPGGAGGGSGTAGGSGNAGGTAFAGGSGTAGGATAGGGAAGGGTAGGGTAGGGMMTVYEPCCTNGRVGSCACSPQGCNAPAFRPCAMGTCVAPNLSCP
jgi:hypothetical protein